MNDILHHNHENISNSRYPDKQVELIENLKKQAEIMQTDISVLERLAKVYYETEKIIDYTKYIPQKGVVMQDTEDEEILDPEYIYTLIKYHEKDVLVQVGEGIFDTEVFIKTDIQKTKGFSHSPLALFVTNKQADAEYKHVSEIKTFLQDHAIIYSPKGGQAEWRISSKEKEQPIDYGKRNAHIHYQDVLSVMQQKILNKLFKTSDDKEKAINVINNLQNVSIEEFTKLINRREDHDSDAQKLLFSMLKNIVADGEDKIENMQYIIKGFDTQKLSSK